VIVMFIRRVRPSPSMVVACIALAIALGGTSYAALKLPARSVGTKQLKPKAVTRTTMRDNAVNGAKVADDSLAGADIVEGSLGKVPAAASADTATAAGHAAALDAVNYRVATGAVPTAPDDVTPSIAVASAFCDAGQHVTGGGVKVDAPTSSAVLDSYPDFGGTLWTAHISNDDPTAPHGFTVYAICVASAAAG
jgi:hypothetical protein